MNKYIDLFNKQKQTENLILNLILVTDAAIYKSLHIYLYINYIIFK